MNMYSYTQAHTHKHTRPPAAGENGKVFGIYGEIIQQRLQMDFNKMKLCTSENEMKAARKTIIKI